LEKGKLYIVATPIGNMEDITLRAIRILEEVDLIAAEDTRHTIKLLNNLGIKKKMISFHEHSDKVKEDEIIDLLLLGKNIALVSDAGTPLIRDPGADLVSKVVEKGIIAEPIPGACAMIAALSACGKFREKFVFEGFLPSKAKDRKEAIEDIKTQTRTVVLYEAPHRILKTLKEMEKSLGGLREIVLAREITKIYEEFIRGSLSDVIKKIENRNIKGEIVLIISGCKQEEIVVSDEQIIKSLNKFIENGDTKKDAVVKTASILSVCKNKVYKISIDH